MDWQRFGSRLGPWIALVCLAALLLVIASVTCFGGLLLCFLSVCVAAAASHEAARSFNSETAGTRSFFLLSLLPPVSVMVSFARLGVCGPDILLKRSSEAFGTSLLLVIALLFTAGILRGLEEREVSGRWFSGIFPAVLFIAAGAGALCTIATFPRPAALLGWMILIAAANDSFAYLAGSLIGGKNMAPSISPSKTWTGAAGGLIGGVVLGVLTGIFLVPDAGLFRLVLFSVFIGIGGQTGDLVASYIKRFTGTKDFGSLLGSHGGVLDRADSHFGAAMLFLVALQVTM